MSPWAVLTRDADGARPYADALRPLGLDCIALPVTCTADAEPADQRALALAVAEPWDGVLVASARAVAPLVRALGDRRLAGRVVAVGPATAAELARHGITAEVADGDGVAAAEMLLAAGCRRVLVPRAAGGRDEAIDRLRGAGVAATAINAYRTITATGAADLDDGLDRIAGGSAAVIALFAPSQVGALAELLAARGASLAALSSSVVAAIGATTAASLVARGVRVDAVASRPEPAAMAQAVAAVYPTAR